MTADGGTPLADQPRPEQPVAAAVGVGATPNTAAEIPEDLIALVQAGDERAFTVLYCDLQPRLRRYAASIVGDEADDVTSEAWLQITRDLRSFSGDLNAFRGWAARIVRNRALDHVRARARRPVQPTSTGDAPDSVAIDDTATAAMDRLSTAAAIRLIASLPRDQSEAVLLRAVVGLDAKSAGNVVGKSATAVRVSAHRGLKALAKKLRTAEQTRTDKP